MEKLNKIFRAAEIIGIDKYTIENEPITSLELMERASRVWVENFLQKFGNFPRIAIVTGIGNNGGDGYAIARMLKNLGREVIVFQLVFGVKMSMDCEENRKRYREQGGECREVAQLADIEPGDNTLIIDAIFGTGLTRKVTGLPAEVIRKINTLDNKVVAVDMPSGLMGEDNSENDTETIIQADYTFTFQFPKIAFMLAENYRYVGEWSVLDIGLHPGWIKSQATPYYSVSLKDIVEILPSQQKFAHKGTNGRGLLVAGSYGMMGAAVLAAKSAVRSGIGLLYCYVPASERSIIHITIPEALTEIGESESSFPGEHNMEKYNAVAIGPAIGKGPIMVEGLGRLLTGWRGTTIIDADALNILSEHRELLDLLHEQCILTPHIKEFERLAGKCGNDFERLNKLSNFANRYNVNVVLKGAYTVTASPMGDLYFNMSGNPGMAKGGSGDVLTGVLLGLAANGMQPLEVALAGVYAHGLAGDIAETESGMRGICAGMIAEGMGRAWRKLERKM